MIIVIESMAMCFLMLLVCVIGIANGPVGSVYFYESEVQEKVIELGLITQKVINKRKNIAVLALLVPMLVFVPLMVYFVNGAREFKELFLQICTILLIEGLFDRLFIDWYWVGKTKAWFIPGTEELMPYVPKKALIKKWIITIVGYPIIAAIMAAIITMF